ncbi:MBL fold metallo-hydrolase [Paraflavisolibacter sp. H34]|uniref:MBL fold metallo-hydrolase n=1 Tax=Huijunlia imazamoxiresistens TaxID=3127457 RepID=UPI00301A1E97
MKSWQLHNGYTIYQLLHQRSNAFLIHTGRDYLMVDTGISWARRALAARLQELRVPEDGIKYLILTHTHFDHCGSARYIVNHFKASAIVHACESFYLEGGFSPLPQGATPLTKIVSRIGMLLQPLFTVPKLRPAILVDRLFPMQALGYDIDIIQTPGHSPGSVSVLVNHEIALVGDALFGVYAHSVIPPFYNDFDLLAGSMKKLADSGCRLYLPGHGREITGQRLKAQCDRLALPSYFPAR